MNNNIRYLLIGNSRLHWAEFKNNTYKFTHTSLKDSLNTDINPSNLIWASVGNQSNLKLNKNNEVKTKDIDSINIPIHFGVDRALNCFCALKTIENPYKKNLLIADFGTTLSITKMNNFGIVLGGQLIPGLKTQLNSMVENTKLLEFPDEVMIPSSDFLIDSKEAMLKGVINSLIGVINLLFNPHEDILILCGGDSKLFGKLIKDKENLINIRPNLTIEGLILFADSFLRKNKSC